MKNFTTPPTLQNTFWAITFRLEGYNACIVLPFAIYFIIFGARFSREQALFFIPVGLGSAGFVMVSSRRVPSLCCGTPTR